MAQLYSKSPFRQYSFSRDEVDQNSHLLIRVIGDDAKHRFLTVDAVNVDARDWVFGCKAVAVHKMTKICEKGKNLSPKTRMLPSSSKAKRKVNGI
jgi:hypothetical protein